MSQTEFSGSDAQPAELTVRSRRGLLLLLATVALVSFACAFAGAETPDPKAAEGSESRLQRCEIYPLGVGTRWTYRSGPLIVEERVSAHETINGEMCARIETRFEDKLVSYEHLAVRPDGVYRAASSGNVLHPALKLLNIPVKSGERWEVESVVAGQTIRGEFVTSAETFLVKSTQGEKDRNYQTHRVTGEKFDVAGTTVTYRYDFVPKVGKVKQSAITGGQETTMELIDYTSASELPPRTATVEELLIR